MKKELNKVIAELEKINPWEQGRNEVMEAIEEIENKLSTIVLDLEDEEDFDDEQPSDSWDEKSDEESDEESLDRRLSNLENAVNEILSTLVDMRTAVGGIEHVASNFGNEMG